MSPEADHFIVMAGLDPAAVCRVIPERRSLIRDGTELKRWFFAVPALASLGRDDGSEPRHDDAAYRAITRKPRLSSPRLRASIPVS